MALRFVEDVIYGSVDGRALLLDYLAPDPLPVDPIPTVIWVHGGGWEAGDKQGWLSDMLGEMLVQAGFVSISVGYRLSDEAIFPAQINDVKAAIRWVRANADALGSDPDRIGIWGHSAGGHLAALAGTSGDLAGLEGESGTPGMSSRVQAVVAVSPPANFLDLPPDWPYVEPRRATSKLVGGPLEERRELVRLANPIAHIQPDAPAFLIIHGKDDTVVPVQQAIALADALTANASEVSLVLLPDADHMLAAPAHGITAEDAWFEVGRQAMPFFVAHLKPTAT